jgi:hypothetical protein
LQNHSRDFNWTCSCKLGRRYLQTAYCPQGAGKSGGFRTIIFFKAHKTAFFILGFAKNAQESLERDEIAGLKDLAGRMLNYDEKTIALALKNGAFEEVICEENVS